MKIRQISIFIENKVGRLKEVTDILGSSNINIRALSLADTSDFGILRMIVEDIDRAMGELRKHGIIAKESHVVAVEVPDRPGGLAKVLDILVDAGINIEYMYAFFEKPEDSALLIFRFEKTDEAIDVLLKNGINISDEKKLGVH